MSLVIKVINLGKDEDFWESKYINIVCALWLTCLTLHNLDDIAKKHCN